MNQIPFDDFSYHDLESFKPIEDVWSKYRRTKYDEGISIGYHKNDKSISFNFSAYDVARMYQKFDLDSTQKNVDICYDKKSGMFAIVPGSRYKLPLRISKDGNIRASQIHIKANSDKIAKAVGVKLGQAKHFTPDYTFNGVLLRSEDVG